MRSKSKKHQKIENKKANEKKEDEEEEDISKNRLKRVFPDNTEKTEKCIQSLKTKIEKLESKLRRKVFR